MIRDLPRKLHRAQDRFFYPSCIAIVRTSERFVGAAVLPAFLVLITLGELVRPQRWRDFAHFKTLRETLPTSFWKGLGPKSHYVRMLYTWHATVFCEMLYDRWRLPRLEKRITVHGTPPEELLKGQDRPVVVVFLHTGAFGFLHSWLRSRTLPLVNLGFKPPVVSFFERVHAAGDLLYHTPVPHYLRPNQLRAISKHLAQQGNALSIAIDGQPHEPGHAIGVGGRPMHLHEGAVRFAVSSGALLIPVAATRTGLFRFAVHYGRPVPDDLLVRGNPTPALEWLATELWAGLEADPSAVTWTTLESLAPDKVVRRLFWP